MYWLYSIQAGITAVSLFVSMRDIGGRGGGFVRTGQPQGALLFEGDTVCVGRSNRLDAVGPGCGALLQMAFPILGKSSETIPKSMQAPRERKK